MLDPTNDKFYFQGKRSKTIEFAYANSLDQADEHELGVVPDVVQSVLVATAAAANYSIGDVVANQNVSVNAGTGWGWNYDVTNVETHTSGSPPWIVNKTTNAIAAITPSDWNIRYKVMAID